MMTSCWATVTEQYHSTMRKMKKSIRRAHDAPLGHFGSLEVVTSQVALGMNGGKDSISSPNSERPEVSQVVASALAATSHFCFDTSSPLESGSQKLALTGFFFSLFVS